MGIIEQVYRWFGQGCQTTYLRYTGEKLYDARSYEGDGKPDSGVLHGPTIWYHRDGSVMKKTPYVMGVVNGTELEYYSDSHVWFERTYLNGKLHDQ